MMPCPALELTIVSALSSRKLDEVLLKICRLTGLQEVDTDRVVRF